ncbi:bifunctional DNA primase/polymerase, partial [Chloroflexota bacterium]
MEQIQFYQDNGLSFFPIPHGKKEANIAWKPYQDRKPTDQEVESWFNNGHQHNIAVITGFNNLVVLDCDCDDRFYELDNIVFEKTGESLFDFTRVSKTSRGFHIWLFIEELPPNQKFPKLDIKSTGGYVIAPPSLHPSGAEYQFVQFDIPIRHIKSLKDIGIDLEQKQTSQVQTFPEGELIPRGVQNEWLFKRASSYRRQGDTEATILAKLILDLQRCDQDMTNPFTENDLLQI